MTRGGVQEKEVSDSGALSPEKPKPDQRKPCPYRRWQQTPGCVGLVPRKWGALPHGLGCRPHAIRGALLPEEADIGVGARASEGASGLMDKRMSREREAQADGVACTTSWRTSGTAKQP